MGEYPYIYDERIIAVTLLLRDIYLENEVRGYTNGIRTVYPLTRDGRVGCRQTRKTQQLAIGFSRPLCAQSTLEFLEEEFTELKQKITFHQKVLCLNRMNSEIHVEIHMDSKIPVVHLLAKKLRVIGNERPMASSIALVHDAVQEIKFGHGQTFVTAFT